MIPLPLCASILTGWGPLRWGRTPLAPESLYAESRVPEKCGVGGWQPTLPPLLYKEEITAGEYGAPGPQGCWDLVDQRMGFWA